MNAPRIRKVKPLASHRLLVTFVNGVQKIYDCTALLNHNAFRLLKEEAFFKSVVVDAGGYGVSWNDDTDLSEYELWTGGVESVIYSPQFEAILQEARQEIVETGGIPHDEFWRQVDAEYEAGENVHVPGVHIGKAQMSDDFDQPLPDEFWNGVP